MGRRGVVYHVRGNPPAKHFERLGVRCAVLARNRSWTSFAPLGRPPTGETMSRALGAPVLAIWSDDDVGASLDFFAPDGWSAQLPIPLGSRPGPPSASDRALFAHLAKTGVVPRARIEKLAAGMRRTRRAAWLEADGVETAIGVPYTRPLPVPLTEKLLRALGIAATLVKPSRRAKAPPPRPAAKAKTPRTKLDPRVLGLHVHYWSELFQMNCWKLYNRYKKHLPAERRREVDELCNHVALGDEDKIRPAVETILSTIWSADDWDAAIRDPELIRWEPLGAAQLDDWHQRLAAR